MTPFISIIIPVYNTEKYLAECLDSIINQTYKNIEVIVVDDGSTDASGKICDEYAKIDDRVKVFHSENSGVAAARKKGVLYSRGEYIGFVDSDDWIENVMYEKLVELLLQDNEMDMVCCGASAVSATGGYECLNMAEEKKYVGESLYNLCKIMMFNTDKNAPGIFQSACSKLFKKSLLEKVISQVDNRITHGEDAAIVYNCCLQAKRIVVCNDLYYYYRIHNESRCRARDLQMFDKIRLFYDCMTHDFSCYSADLDLQRQLKFYICHLIQLGINNVFEIECNVMYHLCHEKIKADKKIILYGAGKVGAAYYNQLSSHHEIILWVDKMKAGNRVCGQIIAPIDTIKDTIYDKILIAVKGERLASAITQQLSDMGVEDEKIVWIPPKENVFQWQINIK